VDKLMFCTFVAK